MQSQNMLKALLLVGFLAGVDVAAEGQDCGDSIAPAKMKKWSADLRLAGGQITLPFKIRPIPDEHRGFRLTTDVTIGGYVGVSKPLSPERNYRLTVPLSAGLTFINLDNDYTSLDLERSDTEVVPGLSWCTGVVLQLENCNVGVVVGKDYASEVGDQWHYHGKWWWSFAIGYTFIGAD